MAAVEERADGINSDQIRPEDLLELLNARERPAVSLYVPSAPSRTNVQTDKIRVKNVLKQADALLRQRGLGSGDIEPLLHYPRTLLPDAHFWSYQGLGLVFFLSPAVQKSYRLPFAVPELVVAGEAFHVKPLLPAMRGERSFYVLALSQKQVRLFESSDHTVRELDLPGLRPMQEALGFDFEDQQLQLYTQKRGGSQPRGAAMFFGHADSEQTKLKTRCRQYFQLVDDKVCAVARKVDAPLVLATVEYLAPIYREVNRHPRLMPEAITGSPERSSGKDLHEAAGRIVARYFDQQVSNALARYHEVGDRTKTSGVLQHLAIAAARGQVDTLFVRPDVQRWGTVDLSSETVEIHDEYMPGDQDLLDFCAVHTYVNDGKVYALGADRIPGEREAAAILRYPFRVG